MINREFNDSEIFILSYQINNLTPGENGLFLFKGHYLSRDGLMSDRNFRELISDRNFHELMVDRNFHELMVDRNFHELMVDRNFHNSKIFLSYQRDKLMD